MSTLTATKQNTTGKSMSKERSEIVFNGNTLAFLTIIIAIVALGFTMFGIMRSGFESVNTRIDDLSTSVNTRIDDLSTSVNTRIDEVNTRIDEVNTRIDELGASINSRIDTILNYLIEQNGSSGSQ